MPSASPIGVYIAISSPPIRMFHISHVTVQVYADVCFQVEVGDNLGLLFNSTTASVGYKFDLSTFISFFELSSITIDLPLPIGQEIEFGSSLSLPYQFAIQAAYDTGSEYHTD